MLDEARSLANEHLAAITAIREGNLFALDLVWAADTRAWRFFRSVGASRYVRAAESLLAASA
jgi:hypothetical protein